MVSKAVVRTVYLCQKTPAAFRGVLLVRLVSPLYYITPDLSIFDRNKPPFDHLSLQAPDSAFATMLTFQKVLSLYLCWASATLAAPVVSCSRSSSTSYDLPLIRNPYYGYLANVSIGTPPQELSMFVDWTWTSQYVLSTVCSNGTQDTSECLSAQQQLFNETLSTTFTDKTTEFPDQAWYPNLFFPAPFEVSYATDVQTLGPVSSPITLQLSDIGLGLLTQTQIPFAGILGLMPSSADTAVTQQSSFYQQYLNHAWPAPYVAFAMCPAASCPPGADGVQTFGGYSTTLASKGLTWYPVIPVPDVNDLAFPQSPSIYSYWAIGLSAFSIGDEVQELDVVDESQRGATPAGIFDHASRGRGLPLSAKAYQRLVQVANATLIPTDSPSLLMPPNNGMQPFYEVDCAAVCSLPTVSYTFKGSPKTWEVTPDAYVARAEGSCILNVRVIGNGTWELGNFGDTFLAGKYLVFDYEKNQVGLAEL